MGYKRKILRRDGIAQLYTFKNRITFKKRYKFTGERKGRYKLFQSVKSTRQPETIRTKVMESMKTKRDAVEQLQAIKKKTARIPSTREVRKMIDSKLLVPYEKRYTTAPTRQESFKMYRHWLKKKGLTDMKLVSRIANVDRKVMRDGIKAYITMFNEKGTFVGMVTVYGVLPHEVGLITDVVKGIDYSQGIVDSPGKLAETLDVLKDSLRGKGIIRSMKRKIQEDTGDYRVTRFECKFDFA